MRIAVIRAITLQRLTGVTQWLLLHPRNLSQAAHTAVNPRAQLLANTIPTLRVWQPLLISMVVTPSLNTTQSLQPTHPLPLSRLADSIAEEMEEVTEEGTT